MLKIMLKKRLIISSVVSAGVLVPAMAFAVGNIAKTNNSYADGIDTAAAAVGIPDRNLYGCVVDSYNADNNTSIPKTQQLTTEQLESMKNLWCTLGNDKTYAVQNYTGLIKLKNLVSMDLSGQTLKNVVFPGCDSGNRFDKLTTLKIENSGLTEFSAQFFPALKVLKLNGNKSLKNISLYHPPASNSGGGYDAWQ